MSPTRKTQTRKKQMKSVPSKRETNTRRQSRQERYFRNLLGEIRDLEKAKKTCEENRHPYATLGGDYAPNNHLRCPVCEVVFYDENHPTYKEAIKKGEIDPRYD